MFFDLLFVSTAVLLNSRTVMARAGTPCQSVSSMSVAYASVYPEATRILVPADAAADCLKSVPVDVEESKLLLKEIQLYLNWQSNLAYLANPPEGYKGERTDVAGELKRISESLDKGEYKDDYTLHVDIKKAFDKTYDFHTNWVPDILNVFEFRRGDIGKGLFDEFALASVSSDGQALPKLYNYYDILVAEHEGWEPSPIVKINNEPAEEYVLKWSEHFQFLEDHARYNQLFPNQASSSMGQHTTRFGRSTYYDGESTFLEYENGTTQELINTVSMGLDYLDGVEDGEAFFERFCNLGPPKEGQQKRSGELNHLPNVQKRGAALRDERLQMEVEASKVRRQTATPSATGYPTAEILQSELALGGYYLEGDEYKDVAVLTIPDFGPKETEEFQDITGTFIHDAANAGKKKLIVDLRGNGGGRLFLGYDVFKQLFPSKDPYGAARFRANEAFDLTGQYVSEVLANVTYEDALADFELNGSKGEVANIYKSMFNYKLPLTVDNDNFTSWEDYFGPHERNGDNFTTVARWDLNNFFSDDLSMDITGYASRTDLLNRNQPFESKNIVMLLDGTCGSTCAVFAEFMKIQGEVEAIVVGGKPEEGPMQGVAGSKGSQVYGFFQVYSEAARAYRAVPDHQAELNKTEMGELVNAHRPIMRTAWGADGNSRSRINLRDNIRLGDETETPLEFVYEASDCRLFWTSEMIRDVTSLWKKTARVQWGGEKEKLCVKGSTGHISSLSGGAKTEQALAQEDDNTEEGGGLGKPNSAASRMGSSLAGAALAITFAAFML